MKSHARLVWFAAFLAVTLTLSGTPDPRVTVGCTCISTWSQCLPWCTVSFNSISYHITTDLNTKFLSGSRRVNWYLTSLQEQFWKRSNTTRAFPICWGVSDEFWCLPLVFSMTRQGHFTSGSVSEDLGWFFFSKTQRVLPDSELAVHLKSLLSTVSPT